MEPTPLVGVCALAFKPLRAPVPNVGFYSVSFSSLNHRQRASVIPVSQILSELVAYFLDLGWTAATVYQAITFYLNPYLRHYSMRFYLTSPSDFYNSTTAHRSIKLYIVLCNSTVGRIKYISGTGRPFRGMFSYEKG